MITPSRVGALPRRLVVGGFGVVVISGGAAALLWGAGSARAETIAVVMSPYCGCCGEWASYLETHGFRIKVEYRDDLEPVKLRAGVPEGLASCHTAFVDGYVLEGHVPAPAIRRLLAERPALAGIAVAGMPADAPGMGGGGMLDVIGFKDGVPTGLYMRAQG